MAVISNPTVDPVPFGHWTLRDKAAQRRSPPRWGSYSRHGVSHGVTAVMGSSSHGVRSLIYDSLLAKLLSGLFLRISELWPDLCD